MPAEVVLAVWTAEDGRCEACGRAMDKRFARVARADATGPHTAANLHLLCLDCKLHWPEALSSRRIALSAAVTARLLGTLAPEQLEPAQRWLAQQLRRYAVLVGVGSMGRWYWLPGVGTFRVTLPQTSTAIVEEVQRITAQPAVKVQPQARTRGLPRPVRERREAL